MSQSKLTPGATPSRRLSMKEFFKNKMELLDDNHTKLIIKKLALEKDLAHTQDQVTMHEGAVLFLNQMIKEWTVYENDTLRLRDAEERARQQKLQEEQQAKEASPKKRKRTNKKGK